MLANETNQTFNFIDVGARGNLEHPWGTVLKSKIRVIGFEPDQIEAERLQREDPTNLYIPYALGAHESEKEFYLNENEFTSSMYKPNTSKINIFEQQHWLNRKVKKKILVKATTLDKALVEKNIDPDFIKIDTQGSELDILKGAKSILTSKYPLVLAETWFYPVYEGAPLSWEVLDFMRQCGYIVLAHEVGAAWKYNSLLKNRRGRSVLIGMDFLFFKDPQEYVKENIPIEKIEKAVCLLELYGFRDVALFILENIKNNSEQITSLKSKLIMNEKKENSFLGKLKCTNNKYVRKIMNPFYKNKYTIPKLHY